jgi:hypothetical protein
MTILEQKMPVETVKRMIGFSLNKFIETGEFEEDLDFYKKSKMIVSKHKLYGNENLLINLAYCKDKDAPVRWLNSLSLIEEYMEQQIYPNGRIDQYGNLNKENSSIYAQRILFNILLALFEENDLETPFIFDIPDDFLEIWNKVHYDSITMIEPEFGNEFIKIFEENRFPPEISHQKEFELMERIVNLGNIIRVLHNYMNEKLITKRILSEIFERLKEIRSKYKF